MRYFENIENFAKSPAKVINAWGFAKDKHDATGAIRKHSGMPYFVHPEGVAKLAIAYGGTDEEVCAAFLHDTLEDTETDYEEIKRQFGEDVADLVNEVTNDRAAIDKVGKEHYINWELLQLSDSALFVKLCDMLYNCEDFPRKSQKDRMLRNIDFLKDARALTKKNQELIDAIEATVED